MPAGRWQERPLKHIELLSLFIPQRRIDQSELWCCFNNVQFTIHWLPSTHSIINFTDLFSKSTWFCTICGEGEQCHQEEGGWWWGARGWGRLKGESHLPSSFKVAESCTSCADWQATVGCRRDCVWCTNISPPKSSGPAKNTVFVGTVFSPLGRSH